MKTVWFRPEHNKDSKKKQDFQDSIVNSRVLIDRFLELLDAMKESIERKEENIDTFTGDYAFKQVFFNGQRKVIKDIEGLFDFENIKGNNP